jgi:hypothetical protein
MAQVNTKTLKTDYIFIVIFNKRFIFNLFIILLALSSSITLAKGAKQKLNDSCVGFTTQVPKFSLDQKKWVKKIFPYLIKSRIDLLLSSYLDSIAHDSTGYELRFNSLETLRNYTNCFGATRILLDGSKTIIVKEINDSVVVYEL